MKRLKDLLLARTVVGGGIYFCLTRRCPLQCAHCYTNSHPAAVGELDDDSVIRFVKSFTDAPPTWVLLSGGEPFLKAPLISRMGRECRTNGVQVYVNTGLYFAKGKSAPATVVRALDAIDHLSISMDPYHAAFVPVPSAVRFMGWFLNKYQGGKGLSVQLCESAKDRSFTTALKDQLQVEFGGAVEVAVMKLQAVGRGSELPSNLAQPVPVIGCMSLGWPQVAFDGQILPCCTSVHLAQSVPEHLVLGNLNDTTWPEVRRKLVERKSLRFIRACGPGWLEQRYSSADARLKRSVCKTCAALPSDLESRIEADDLARDVILPYVEADHEDGLASTSHLIEYVE